MTGPVTPGRSELGSNACWTGAGTAAKPEAAWTAQGQSLALNKNLSPACDPDQNEAELIHCVQSDGVCGGAGGQERRTQIDYVQCVLNEGTVHPLLGQEEGMREGFGRSLWCLTLGLSLCSASPLNPHIHAYLCHLAVTQTVCVCPRLLCLLLCCLSR